MKCISSRIKCWVSCKIKFQNMPLYMKKRLKKFFNTLFKVNIFFFDKRIKFSST